MADGTVRELALLGLGDDASRGDVIAGYLSSAGYLARVMAPGELAERKPLGIILDLSPYGGDGWDILLSVKKDPKLREIPVLPVFLSEEGKVGGIFPVAGFFTLPVDANYLAKKLTILGLTEDVETYDLQAMIVSRRGEEVFQGALEEVGFEIVNAYTGKEGLALGTITPPYMAFSQLMLPDMPSFELLEKFRLYPQLRNVPFFVLMKDSMKEAEKKEASDEIANYVRKKELSREEFLVYFRRRG